MQHLGSLNSHLLPHLLIPFSFMDGIDPPRARPGPDPGPDPDSDSIFSKPRPRPPRSPAHAAQIRAQNRRREYLRRHPSYLQSSEHEFAGEYSPLPYFLLPFLFFLSFFFFSFSLLFLSIRACQLISSSCHSHALSESEILPNPLATNKQQKPVFAWQIPQTPTN